MYYTICWLDNGCDRWHRVNKKGALRLLQYLENHLGSLEDVLIFPPDSEISINDI